jgi:ribosomal-protein-alanine N-acetyltransferase
MPLEEDTRAHLLERLRQATADEHDERATALRWMVERAGEVVGTVAARNLDRRHGRLEVGYMLGESHLGRGYGTRAMTLLLARLFALPWLQRVWLNTAADNLASQALARKLGFVHEGTLRGHLVICGVRKDEQLWGLMREEWQARAPLLLASPANP